ncbi:hypothetical protein [Kineococcus rubinsiae]|uniref:hypothetical protein n=1 Tax=Kineococcus rubinsiae TaxID=2609562 RepID=UPI001431F2AD|nr:hypothetical protein [Kineococcus rubinsiae]NIZ90277.1 hypothetical protein [Kineococcus rubinsiae]
MRRDAVVSALLTAAAGTAGLLLSSCGDAGGPNGSLQGELIIGDEKDATMTAAMTGPLERVGACIGIGSVLVVWPAHTTWESSTSTLTLPGGKSYTLGQELETGGGSISQKTLAENSKDLAQAFAECNAPENDDVWVM